MHAHGGESKQEAYFSNQAFHHMLEESLIEIRFVHQGDERSLV